MSKTLDELIVKKQEEIQHLVALNNRTEQDRKKKVGQSAAAATVTGRSQRNIRSILGLGLH